jgi:hypothetical protein
MHGQSQKIDNPDNLKVFGASKLTKVPKRFVTDVVYHMYLCLKSTVPKLYN